MTMPGLNDDFHEDFYAFPEEHHDILYSHLKEIFPENSVSTIYNLILPGDGLVYLEIKRRGLLPQSLAVFFDSWHGEKLPTRKDLEGKMLEREFIGAPSAKEVSGLLNNSEHLQ